MSRYHEASVRGPHVSAPLAFLEYFLAARTMQPEFKTARSALLVHLAVAWSLLAEPAGAQTVGVRAAVSVDPDQFYFGGHAETLALTFGMTG